MWENFIYLYIPSGSKIGDGEQSGEPELNSSMKALQPEVNGWNPRSQEWLPAQCHERTEGTCFTLVRTHRCHADLKPHFPSPPMSACDYHLVQSATTLGRSKRRGRRERRDSEFSRQLAKRGS